MRVNHVGKSSTKKHWFERNAYEVFREKVSNFESTYIAERYKIEQEAKQGSIEAAEILLKKYHARILTLV